MSIAQVEITLEGDPNDSSFIAQVEKMKAAGFDVKINETEPDPLEVNNLNKKLLSFSLVTLEGDTITSEDLIGKKIHINFWSTTCKPCIEEFPELNSLKKNYEEQGYVFLGIAPESPRKINKILAKRPFDYIIIPDAKRYLKNIGVDAFPVNFFVDAEGIVKEIITGATYRAEIIYGKQKLVPDNYEGYELALKGL
jgi:thiol-disulfide isomerase/thioredoxin